MNGERLILREILINPLLMHAPEVRAMNPCDFDDASCERQRWRNPSLLARSRVCPFMRLKRWAFGPDYLPGTLFGRPMRLPEPATELLHAPRSFASSL
jgi:hypothetical protein